MKLQPFLKIGHVAQVYFRLKDGLELDTEAARKKFGDTRKIDTSLLKAALEHLMKEQMLALTEAD